MVDEPENASPRTFGSYNLLRELGHGGQGTVWLAQDQRLKRDVALKVLSGAPGAIDGDRLARFKREAEAAARLDDPHICSLLDVGDVDGVPFLAFRYVAGQTLADRIARAFELREGHSLRDGDPPSDGGTTDPSSREGIQRIVRTFEKIARALHKAHERGLVHRDVKPGNVMITPDGEPVLLDFGLARDELAAEHTLTQSGDLLGTPAYMSPEQLMAHRVPLDRRTDVYSLGATLYEALTLRRPHAAATRAELYQRILHETPTTAVSVNRQIPRDLQVVLETAMEKDRNRRYQTAQDLAEDLRRFRDFEPIRAKPIGALLRVRRWAQRHPVLALGVVGLGLALAVSVAFIAELDRELSRSRARGLALAAADASGADQTLALLLALEAVGTERNAVTLAELHRAFGSSYERVCLHHDDQVVAASFSPDGRSILTASRDRTARLWDLQGRELRRFEFEAPVSLAVFAPGGRTIATVSGIEVTFWDPAGDRIGGFRASTAVQTQARGPLQFTPGGDAVVLPGPGFSVLVVALDGQERGRFDGHEGRLTSVALSPDGASLLTASADGTARVWDLQTGDAQLVLRHGDTVQCAAFSPDGRLLVTAAEDSTVRLWTRAGELRATMPGHGGSAFCARFSPDGASIVTGAADGVARLFDLSGRQIAAFRGHRSVIHDVTMDAAGDRVLTASRDGSARVWDLQVTEAPVLRGHTDAVRSATFSRDGGRLLTAGNDDTFRISDSSGRLRDTFGAGRPGAQIFYAEFSPAPGGQIVTADAFAATATVWDSDGEVRARLEGHTDEVRSAVFSRDGQRILTASVDGTAALWDLGGSRIQLFRGHEDFVQFASFSPDEGRVATASGDGQARIFDVASGEVVRAFAHPSYVTSATFTPSGEFLLTSCADGVARLWAVDDETRPARTFEGSGSSMLFATVSPDGRTVLTSARDNAARLWSLETGELITVLKGHEGIVWRCAFSPDGARVATASWDRTARVWVTDPDELLRLARTRSIRDFTAEERDTFRDLLGR